jgi:hypothetical protein
LDLIQKKLETGPYTKPTFNSDKQKLPVAAIEKHKKSLSQLFEKWSNLLENDWVRNTYSNHSLGVNQCLLRALDMADMSDSRGAYNITLNTESHLPPINANPQELTTVLLILLVLSKVCVANVSNKTLVCETRKEQHNIVTSISHNGFIPQENLDILFHDNPLEGYFMHHVPGNRMETLLHCASFLLKKNNIQIRLTNIPGYFDLSLIVPARLE